MKLTLLLAVIVLTSSAQSIVPIDDILADVRYLFRPSGNGETPVYTQSIYASFIYEKRSSTIDFIN